MDREGKERGEAGMDAAKLSAIGRKTQGQFWDVQLAGGQRSISMFALTWQGSPDPQLPMPDTVERLVPLMRLSPPFCTDPD